MSKIPSQICSSQTRVAQVRSYAETRKCAQKSANERFGVKNRKQPDVGTAEQKPCCTNSPSPLKCIERRRNDNKNKICLFEGVGHGGRVVIFFSFAEAPLPDPTPTPPNTPKRTRNGAETEPKRSQTEPNGPETGRNGAEMDRNQAFWGGTSRGFFGMGGGGGCRGKRKAHGGREENCPKRRRFSELLGSEDPSCSSRPGLRNFPPSLV